MATTLLRCFGGWLTNHRQLLMAPDVSVIKDHQRGAKKKASKGGQGNKPISRLKLLPPKVLDFVQQSAQLCRPGCVHVCDGSPCEFKFLFKKMESTGSIIPLPKYENCWLAQTDPRDVDSAEDKVFITTTKERNAVAIPKKGVARQLGNYMSQEEADAAIRERLPSCMRGQSMYVIPFSMGPIGSPMSKIGIQLTDSPYVANSMSIMTRVGTPVLDLLAKGEDFVKCLHAAGNPVKPSDVNLGWRCDPERAIVLHRPETKAIISYGSGFGNNALLSRKGLGLRLASAMAFKEGGVAEHMLIIGVTNPKGKKKYIAAAFPPGCGKHHLATMTPTLPGFKVECVASDIAWMKFDKDGRLRAINPEYGFFGVAPETSMATNPNVMKMIFKNTIFTNVATTTDGGVYWDGMDESALKGVNVCDWMGEPWMPGNPEKPAAHPNARYCSPMSQCPNLDAAWQDPEGVPIDAIVFGTRRSEGVPLIYEACDWQHGVFLGASLRTEIADECEEKTIVHDPFGMRPYFGYNFGDYLCHWLKLMCTKDAMMPKIFCLNCYKESSEGKLLWPGLGENCRILEWILRRIENQPVTITTPIGYIPKLDSINLKGLKDPVHIEELLCLSKEFWLKEIVAINKYFEEQVGDDLPIEIDDQLKALKARVCKMGDAKV